MAYIQAKYKGLAVKIFDIKPFQDRVFLSFMDSSNVFKQTSISKNDKSFTECVAIETGTSSSVVPPPFIQDENNRLVTDVQIADWNSKAPWPHLHPEYETAGYNGGDLVPATANTSVLGSTEKAFKEAYISGTRINLDTELPTIFFVDTYSGNDNELVNDGSSIKPFKTINKAIGLAIGPTVIYVRAGEYKENITLKNNLKLIGVESETGSGASSQAPILSGTLNTDRSALNIDSKENIEISGFIFKNWSTNDPLKVNGLILSGIVDSCKNIVFRKNTVYPTMTYAINIGGTGFTSSNVKVVDNVFYYSQKSNISFTNVNNYDISNNVFYANCDEVKNPEAAGNEQQTVIKGSYTRNYFLENETMTGVTIHNNTFEGRVANNYSYIDITVSSTVDVVSVKQNRFTDAAVNISKANDFVTVSIETANGKLGRLYIEENRFKKGYRQVVLKQVANSAVVHSISVKLNEFFESQSAGVYINPYVNLKKLAIIENSFTGARGVNCERTEDELFVAFNYWGSGAGPKNNANTYKVADQVVKVDSLTDIIFSPFYDKSFGGPYDTFSGSLIYPDIAKIQEALDDIGSSIVVNNIDYNFLPKATNQYALGATNKVWSNVYSAIVNADNIILGNKASIMYNDSVGSIMVSNDGTTFFKIPKTTSDIEETEAKCFVTAAEKNAMSRVYTDAAIGETSDGSLTINFYGYDNTVLNEMELPDYQLMGSGTNYIIHEVNLTANASNIVTLNMTFTEDEDVVDTYNYRLTSSSTGIASFNIEASATEMEGVTGSIYIDVPSSRHAGVVKFGTRWKQMGTTQGTGTTGIFIRFFAPKDNVILYEMFKV